jgi:hypothetical protein
LPLDNETTFVCFDNGELEDRLVLDCFFGFAPDESLSSFFEGELDVAFLIIRIDNLGCDDVANVDLLYNVAGCDEFTSVNDTCSK